MQQAFKTKSASRLGIILTGLWALPSVAAANTTELNPGDTAWILVSTALVLLMTIPGVALFYGGMVRRKNLLATASATFATTGLITIIWVFAGI